MGKMKVKGEYDIITGEYPFHEQLKEELVPSLENYTDQQGRRTNVKATMTEWDWGNDIERVSRLKSFIVEMTRRIVTSPNLSQDLAVRHLWANIYHHSDYTNSHDHVGVDIFSFAYFLKTEWYHPPFVFTRSGKKIKSKEGTFIIFPSHLKHHVPENKSQETRITLSGNLSVKAVALNPNLFNSNFLKRL